MVKREKIDELVTFLNSEIETKLGDCLDCAYLVGSYTSGNISPNRPDINWLLVHKDPILNETRWKLGEIVTIAIEKYINDFVVRPEPRPFKFSYPIKRGEEVFVNISIITNGNSPNAFKQKNYFIPEYVFEGFKNSRRLIFGKDILKEINFEVTRKSIHDDAINKISSHKIQLDRIPLVYNMKNDIDLIFNESLSHGKNLIYFGVELLMTEEELSSREFLKVYNSPEKMLSYYKERFPEAYDCVKKILSSKENFEEWENDYNRARDLYLAAEEISELLFRVH